MRYPLIVLLLFSTILIGHRVLAQPAGGEAAGGTDDAAFEFGAHIGNLLPNQISGLSEITGLGGVRVGARIAPLSYFETGLIMGNGNGSEWKNLHVDLRMDIPVENLVALAYVGADAIYYKSLNSGTRLIFGGHAGGGMQTQLSGNVWGRADMKFGFSPGTSLYVGFGLEVRLGK